jgi:hypothetical protein
MTTGSSEDRIVVNPALENRVTENRRNLERYSESSHDSGEDSSRFVSSPPVIVVAGCVTRGL